jgi:hypothetical protein
VEIIQEHMEYSLERVPVKSRVPRDSLNICALLGLGDEITGIALSLYQEDEKKKDRGEIYGEQVEP